MMRSLSSGISGLQAHQTRMDVIGNNIANVNTYGFKKSRVTFADIYYQTTAGATQGANITGGGNNVGGTNPTQIGYGAMVNSIDRLDAPSAASMTGRALDVYLGGEGYITTKAPDGSVYYTRLGVLRFDPTTGDLVDSNGNLVQGFNYVAQANRDQNNLLVWDPAGGLVMTDIRNNGLTDQQLKTVNCDIELLSLLTNISIGSDGTITGVMSTDKTIPASGGTAYKENDIVKIGTVCLANFGNSEGLTQVGNSYLQKSANSGSTTYGIPGLLGTGELMAGYLEMSNVDISTEFTDMIITQRGFQANTRIITVSDEMLQELVNLKR